MSHHCSSHLKNETAHSLQSLRNSITEEIESLKERRRIIICVLNAKLTADKNGLVSCHAYKQLTDDEKAQICNGAGAAGQWISSFIPNTMYGLDCTEAFNIHDYDYYAGITQDDKNQADARLFDNLILLINNAGGILQWLRRRRAMKYYEAVHHAGDDAFFKGDKDNG